MTCTSSQKIPLLYLHLLPFLFPFFLPFFPRPRPTLQDAEQLDTHLANPKKSAHPKICQIGWLGRR